MPANVTSDQVWKELGGRIFGVLGTVSRSGQPLATGIVYAVRGKDLYVATGLSTQKTKNIRSNPRVSVTATIEKRIPFLPWFKIPPATITFNGEAAVLSPEQVESGIQKELTGKLKMSEGVVADLGFIKITPKGAFHTYGVGVPLRSMLAPEEAIARVPV